MPALIHYCSTTLYFLINHLWISKRMVNKVIHLLLLLLASYWETFIKIVCSDYPAHKEIICATTFVKIIVFMKSFSQGFFLFVSRIWNYYHVIISSLTTIAYAQVMDLYVQMFVHANIAKTLMKKVMKANTLTLAVNQKMTVKVMLSINLTNGLIK